MPSVHVLINEVDRSITVCTLCTCMKSVSYLLCICMLQYVRMYVCSEQLHNIHMYSLHS